MPAGPSEPGDRRQRRNTVISSLLTCSPGALSTARIPVRSCWTPDADIARKEAVERQLAELPRDTARRPLSASRLIVTKDLARSASPSLNQYGPEHLIIQTRNARDGGCGITAFCALVFRRLVAGIRR